jgi:hypothetical protein
MTGCVTLRGPRHLSELEWLGFIVLAARHLEVHGGHARLLAALIRRSPFSVSSEVLAADIAAGQAGSRRHFATRSMGSVRTLLCGLRGALDDVGLPATIKHTPGQGYSIAPHDAWLIQATILDMVPEGPLPPVNSAQAEMAA